jgi:hypothetical protein
VAALQSYTGPKEELGTAERFLFELLCIPRLKPRLQCFVFILEFNARLHDLSENVEVAADAGAGPLCRPRCCPVMCGGSGGGTR